MKQDIARYVSECDVCRRVKGEHQKPSGTLQPPEIPEWNWDKVQMDFVTGSQITEGKRCDLCRHRSVLQGCSLYTSQGEDHCYLVGRIVYLTNCVAPRYSVGDQF